MTTAIRDYRPDDLEAARALWRALTQRHRDLYGDPSLGGDDPGLEFDAHREHPDLHALWIAERDGAPAGLCGLLVADGEAEIEPIVVDPAQRGRGLGAALLARALDEANALGVRYLNARPVARNVEAIRFFHRGGLRVLGRLELSRPLEGAPPFVPRRETSLHQLSFEF